MPDWIVVWSNGIEHYALGDPPETFDPFQGNSPSSENDKD